MTTVVGVRFREVGKIYYFDPGELDIQVGDHVIVDTARGTEYGTVMIGKRQVEDEEIVPPLKAVRRIATPEDEERVIVNREKEADAFATCKELIKKHELEMKLISAEYTFDNAKVLFYFTADGRVDFRELVKDLAAVFKIRIELRQVGVRDETKLMGGLGGCGRPLCCASYLSDFVPVSIKMAKEQNLSLNPQKISGVCGRLMCCLKNEADTYAYLNTMLPKEGARVTVKEDGREGIAETVNTLRKRVRVMFTDEAGNRELEEFAAEDLQFTPRKKKTAAQLEMESMMEAGIQADPETELDTEDITEELAEERNSEEDPDLKALEEAEISDIEKEEEAESEEPGNRAGRRNRHRHRRRRPHNPAEENGENPGGPESRNRDGQGNADGRNNGSPEDGSRRDHNGSRNGNPDNGSRYGQSENGSRDNRNRRRNNDNRRSESENNDSHNNRENRYNHVTGDAPGSSARDGSYDGSAQDGSYGSNDNKENGDREHRRNRRNRPRRRNGDNRSRGNRENGGNPGSSGSGTNAENRENHGTP